MKALFIIGFYVVLIFCGCTGLSEKDITREFIPGTYIRFSQHEFGSEFDTLSFWHEDKSSNEYKIQRKWKYERILDGKVIEPEYKIQTTYGNYDVNTKLLKDTKTGGSYSFNKEQNVLFAGTTKYQKIK